MSTRAQKNWIENKKFSWTEKLVQNLWDALKTYSLQTRFWLWLKMTVKHYLEKERQMWWFWIGGSIYKVWIMELDLCITAKRNYRLYTSKKSQIKTLFLVQRYQENLFLLLLFLAFLFLLFNLHLIFVRPMFS